MPKYKAKESYKKLPFSENFCAYGSASSHMRLMDDIVIERDVPVELLEHLTEVKPKVEKKTEKKVEE